jgi:hypothetical protein
MGRSSIPSISFLEAVCFAIHLQEERCEENKGDESIFINES